MLRTTCYVILVSGSLLSTLVVAASTSTTMDVTATVGAGGACSVIANSLAFGTIESGTGGNSTSQITVNCQAALPYNVAIDAGTHYDGVQQIRFIQNPGGDGIAYLLFQPDLSTEWGDNGFGGTYALGSVLNGIGTGSPQILEVSGGTEPEGGTFGSVYTPGTSYSDTVTVTINF